MMLGVLVMLAAEASAGVLFLGNGGCFGCAARCFFLSAFGTDRRWALIGEHLRGDRACGALLPSFYPR